MEKIEHKAKTLDEHAMEQAGFYGMTLEKHSAFMHRFAELKEIVEREAILCKK